MSSERATLELGSKASGESFSVEASLVATGRTCVLGSSGSGKSYAVGVLCEELCRNGVPFAIVDTEGEHSGLKEKYEAVWVGDEKGSDLSWDSLDLTDLSSQAPDISPLILDVSDLRDYKAKIGEFLTRLYDTLTERRTPYLVILEEADKFVPQYGERLPIFDEVARRGRKRGLGLMICSQRPSLVDKNVLSQCGNQLIGKLIIQNDLKAVAQFFPGRGYPKELTGVSAGEFFAIGGFSAEPTLVRIRRRTTRHGGVTPAFVKRVVRPYVGTLGAKSPSKESGGHEPGEGGSGKTMPGIRAGLNAEDVPAMVKREKRFGFFGMEETVTSVETQLRGMVQVGVRLRRGLLKRRFETAYLVLDGQTGRGVRISRGLELTRGFERVLGLTTLQAEVLREVSPDADTSAIDLSRRLGESRSTITRVLNTLNDRRLVRTIEVRGKRLFRRLVDLPREPTETSPVEYAQVEVGKARILSPKLKEGDVKEVIKGLWDGADLDSFETFLYPTYKVDLILRRKHRQVILDGRSGEELRL